MIKDTGGPAFPSFEFVQSHGQMMAVGGMTLRDYFAAKVVQAAITNPVGAEGFTFNERAVWAYQQADAMLEAREL